MTSPIFHHQRQNGSLLVTTMVFMAIVMLIASSLFNHLLTTETQAVEDDLAQLRVHWAMVGMMDYALSRFRFEGGVMADSNKITELTNYMDELDGNTGNDNNTLNFIYNEYTVNVDGVGDPDRRYIFSVTGAVVLGTNNNTDTGRLRVTLTLADPRDADGTPLALDTLSPGVQQLRNHIPSMVFELCMRPEPGEIPGPDGTPPTSECNNDLLGIPGDATLNQRGTGSPGESWILEHRREMPPVVP